MGALLWLLAQKMGKKAPAVDKKRKRVAVMGKGSVPIVFIKSTAMTHERAM